MQFVSQRQSGRIKRTLTLTHKDATAEAADLEMHDVTSPEMNMGMG